PVRLLERDVPVGARRLGIRPRVGVELEAELQRAVTRVRLRHLEGPEVGAGGPGQAVTGTVGEDRRARGLALVDRRDGRDLQCRLVAGRPVSLGVLRDDLVVVGRDRRAHARVLVLRLVAADGRDLRLRAGARAAQDLVGGELRAAVVRRVPREIHLGAVTRAVEVRRLRRGGLDGVVLRVERLAPGLPRDALEADEVVGGPAARDARVADAAVVVAEEHATPVVGRDLVEVEQ